MTQQPAQLHYMLRIETVWFNPETHVPPCGAWARKNREFMQCGPKAMGLVDKIRISIAALIAVWGGAKPSFLTKRFD